MTLVGAGLDLARVYQANITLQSATRNAPEYAAMYATSGRDALTAARRIVCLASTSIPGHQGSSPGVCTLPTVEIVSYSSSTKAAGATTKSPIVTVVVRSTIPFKTLVPYPFLTNAGTVQLVSTERYEMAQNR